MRIREMSRMGLMLSVLLVAGCGGGGGGGANDEGPPAAAAAEAAPPAPPAPPVPAVSALEKYLGTWERCERAGASSTLSRTTFLKTTGGEVVATFRGNSFPTPDCSGFSNGFAHSDASVTHKGSKAIGTETVDMVDYAGAAGGGFVIREVLLIRADGKLYVGDRVTLEKDSSGYPARLDPLGATRQ